MKSIISGKTYNTSTAHEIASARSSAGISDMRYWKETLYRTKKGAFFFEGEGGAMSHYAEQFGDMQGPGSGIHVTDSEDALAWCEENGVDVAVIERHFEIEEA